MARGRLVLFCEIGDVAGSGRPIEMDDAHSLKRGSAGFSPTPFNDIDPTFCPLFGYTPDSYTSHPGHPIGRAT